MMKPEKVKSRWRRSSEMEISEKAALCPPEVVIKEEVLDTKGAEVMPSIKEETNSETLNEESSIPDYVELEQNMYLFERKRTKRKKEVRRMLCECSLTKEEREKGVLGCQDECLNRLLMIECGSRCSTGEACSNKRFQKRLYAKVVPFKTTKKGWGLKLLEDVPMGSFVIEYCGEILSRQDFKQRVKQYAREKSNHYYFMSLKTDEIIDATNKGNLSRFMNHSCEPNCETQKWTVNGELRIGFFAKRDLKTGEELTFDYQFQRYGREAQKCYCFTDSCTGYIGVSNEIPVDVSKKAGNKRKKGGSDEKKREDSEDLILEEEIQKLYESGGLRNKENTLDLARLMVRAEDTHSREKLLDILLGTSEIGFLRLFLECHGLSLLWSWMVDLTDLNLKTKILQVLSVLPVSNKTILLDSKVYNVVERWSSNILVENHDSLQLSVDKNMINEVKKIKSCDTSDSENDGTVFQVSEYMTSGQYQNKKNYDSLCSENLSQYLEEGSINSTLTSDAEDNSVTNGKGNSDAVSRSDEEGGEIVDAQNKSSHAELMNLAHSLLTSWKSLKEDFKIPRRGQTNQRFQGYSRYNRRQRNDICRDCLLQGSSFCRHKIEVMTHRNRFSKDRNKDSFSHQEKIWGYRNINDLEEKPRKVLLPTPVVLTKEERRLQFAREVLENDQRKALLKQQQYVDVTNLNGPTENQFYNTNTNYCYLSSDGNYYNANSEGYPLTATETNMLPYNQCYYDLNELQISRSTLLQTPETTNSLNPGALPSIEMNGSTAYQSNVIYQSSHQQLLLHGAQSSPISLHSTNVASRQANHAPTSSNLIVLGNITSPVLPTVKEITPAHAALQSGLYTSIPKPGCMSSHISLLSPNSQYMSGQDHCTNNQNVIYYTQSQYTLSEQISAPHTYSYTDTSDEVIENAITIKLPPNWKTATDADGNIYYYHILTRQTQWDPPMFEEAVEDVDGDTPTYDEPKDHKLYEIHSHRSHKKHSKKKSTTTAPADTSSNNYVNNEVAKKIKELFRTKMSSFVVQCLNPYHRDDCRAGKITSNDDFKHLARKLTHFVMAKELKHCKSVEDLECNENVKHKARDYIYKYMAKYGSVYKKEKYDSPF